MDLEVAAKERRLRTIKLEDGELVIPLRGAKKTRYPSANPHAGVWGTDRWYVMVPTTRPVLTQNKATDFDWALEFTLADDAVLVFGHPNSILDLIINGPPVFRARQRRSPNEAQMAVLSRNAFQPSASKSGPPRAPSRGEKKNPAEGLAADSAGGNARKAR